MESINHARPARLAAPLAGLTEWHIQWRFSIIPSSTGCRCAAFSTRATITNTLPFWRAPTNATYGMKQEWRHYFGNLAAHEAGHSQIALAALAEMHKQVTDLKEEPNGAVLTQKVNDLLENVMDRYRKMDLEYDARTEHGAKQFGAASVPRRKP